ncbi:MAG: GNAT family N-acetyltransferase [Gemmatimonadota bacterium]
MIDVRRDGYRISNDPAQLDIDVVHGFLFTAYWSRGIRREQVVRSIAHSLGYGLFHEASGAQVGFARAISDRTTFGYLADVFVLEPHRGRGLAKWMVRTILADPELHGFRRWLLATRDAHAIYAACGFVPLTPPERWMQLTPDPDQAAG